MNQLSVLLYLANVSGKIETTVIITGIGTAIGAIVLWVVYANKMDDPYRRRDEPKPSRTSAIVMTLLPLLIFLIASFIPSKDTVYAIAVSQVGEEALKTPLAGKAEKALEAWLDKQITSASESK